MENYFRTTDNNMGYELLGIDNIAKSCVEFISESNDWCLEIGSAQGYFADYAMKNNINLCCNDISETHIEVIKNKYIDNQKIQYYIGDFLDLNYKNTYKAIYISRVLHFLNPLKRDLSASL